MPRETILHECGPDGLLVAGYAFLAILAYPNDFFARAVFVEACKLRRALWVTHEHSAPRETFASVEKEIEKTKNIIKKRFLAGFIAINVIDGNMSVNDAATKIANFENNEVCAGRRFNLSEIKKKSGFNKTRTEIIKEIWTPSKPVLHMAYSIVMRDDFDEIITYDLLDNDSWISDTVIVAEKIRQDIIKKSLLRVTEEDTISFFLKHEPVNDTPDR